MPNVPGFISGGTSEQFYESQITPDELTAASVAAAGTGVTSGGVVTSAGGMVLNISSAVISILGVPTILSGGSVTVVPDPTFPCQYLIVASVSGFSLIKGTPSQQPSQPTFSPTTQVLVASIYVEARESSLNASDIVDLRVVPNPVGTSVQTTKGDLAGFSTLAARVPVGSDTQVLTADSTQALGLKWAAAAGGGFAVDGSVRTANFSAATNTVYRVDASGGAVVVTIPVASGTSVIVKNVGASGTVTVSLASGAFYTCDGGLASIGVPGGAGSSRWIIADGTNAGLY